jgi:hypothetical protein
MTKNRAAENRVRSFDFGCGFVWIDCKRIPIDHVLVLRSFQSAQPSRL